jgi:hypothetical protein
LGRKTLSREAPQNINAKLIEGFIPNQKLSAVRLNIEKQILTSVWLAQIKLLELVLRIVVIK